MEQKVLDKITIEYLVKFQAIFGEIFKTAQHLFFYFAVIEIAVIAIFYVLNRESLGDMAAELIKKGLIIGIFLTAMNNAGTWFPMLINFFMDLGANSAGVKSLDPSSVITQGLSISSGILLAINAWGFIKDPLGMILGCVGCIGITLFYGLIAAELAITLIESYCLVAVSPIFMAFGANKLTHTYAMNYLNTAISLGVKLMVLYIVIGVGSTLGKDWSQIAEMASKNHQITAFLGIVVAALIYFLIAKRVPAFIAQIISGISMSSGAEGMAGAVMGASSMAGMAMSHMKNKSGSKGSLGAGGLISPGGLAAQAGSMVMKSAMGSGAQTAGKAAASSASSASQSMGSSMSNNFSKGANSSNTGKRSNSVKT